MKKKIEYILKTNLDNAFAYEKLLDIFFTIGEFPIYKVPVIKESLVYRSRQNDKQNFIDFNELSYPPKKIIKGFGRINKPFQATFYGSDSYKTTITELMPNWFLSYKKGDLISITTSLWTVKQSLSVAMIPDFYNERMQNFIKIAKIESIPDDQLMLLGFINQIFRENAFYNKRIYKITCAFCNTIYSYFEKIGEEIDGILYTSAQDETGWNIALKPSIIDSEKLILKDISKQFFRKINSTPEYDNSIDSIKPKYIDYQNKKIGWK